MFGHRRRSILIPGLVLAAAAVAGCGQKGPLYLYEEPAQQTQVQAELQAQPQEEAEEDQSSPTLESEPGRLTPTP